jgi:hypothetical protein
LDLNSALALTPVPRCCCCQNCPVSPAVLVFLYNNAARAPRRSTAGTRSVLAAKSREQRQRRLLLSAGDALGGGRSMPALISVRGVRSTGTSRPRAPLAGAHSAATPSVTAPSQRPPQGAGGTQGSCACHQGHTWAQGFPHPREKLEKKTSHVR